MERTFPLIALSDPLPEHLWHIVHLDFNIVNTGAGAASRFALPVFVS